MTLHENYLWVRGIVWSADSRFKLKVCDIVVEVFKREYGENDDGWYKVLIDLLSDKYQELYKNTHHE